MELASGIAPTVVALRSNLQGYAPRSALHGGCSSEPLPRCALQPSLYLERALLSASQSGSSSEGPRRVPLTSVSQHGPSSEEPSRASLTGVFQSGSSSEGPRRLSSTEELPRLAPRSHLRVSLHRAFSLKLVFEASPLWRFLGTSFLGLASGEKHW